jgi:TctA family transporter
MVVLLPFSFAFSPDVALSLLLGVFCGGYFGGAVPAVLLKTPGVPSSLVTSFDGYPLTRKGKAQTALSAALMGSFGGGLISVLILIFLAPVLAHVAASFGPPEYFCVAVFGVTLVVMALRDQLGRGLMLLGLGFWFSTVGIDGTSLSERFCFGTMSMQNGLDIVPVCLGLFGIGQTLMLVERELLKTDAIRLSRSSLDFSQIFKVLKYWKTLIRSGVIGTFVGLLPGTGSILAVVIMVISMIGIYAVNTRLFDAFVAVVMGILGYILLRLKWPIVNLVMGVVLGEIIENRLRETLSLGDGSFLILFERPICICLMALTGLIIVAPIIIENKKDKKRLKEQ